MNELLLFVAYLFLLIPIAWLGKKQTRFKSPSEFYLAGSKLGFLVLLCTLFATQYSGNTFMAFPGKAYRQGYWAIVSVTFMMAIVGGYMLFAPQLKKMAKQFKFITPGDWLHHRYKSLPLTLIASFLMSFALLNYFLAQLMAMGHAFSGLTGGVVPYEAGVLFLAFVIVVYESIGGMRAVAWTDTLQGVMMMTAVVLLGYCLFTQIDWIQTLPEQIVAIAPSKVTPPDWKTCMTWMSTILIVGIGGAMYPQGIQRIYAAKSTKTLKRTLAIMVFLPAVVVFFAYMVGMMAIVQFPGLENLQSDEVMVKMLSFFSQQGGLIQFAQAMLLVGALAAIMSTADSALLSLSSIVVQDFYAKPSKQKHSEEKLLKLGKIISWTLTGIVVLIALKPQTTLWRLLEIKFELLIQVAPAFILGFYLPKLKANGALIGLLIGMTLTAIGFLSGAKWFGLHPGVIGCLVNGLICFFMSKVKK